MKRISFVLLLAPLVAACGERTSEGVDSLMKESVYADAAIPVETLALEITDFDERFDAAGVIEADENVTVSAEIGGRIVEVHREIGDRVQRGTSLITLDQSEIDAEIKKIEANLARARTQYEWARRDLARQQELFDQEISAERAFDDAQRLVDTSEDDMSAADADLEMARVRLEKSRIVSPIAGRIATRYVAPGEYVREGTQLYDIVATDRVKFVFSVAERDVIALRPGQRLELRIDAYPNVTWEGTVLAISPAGNPQTRTFRVEVGVENQEETPLLPGMSGRSAVLRSSFEQVYLLPEESVLRDERGSFLYLVENDQARRVEVEILSQVGDRAVVASNDELRGEAIILGQSAVGPGSPVRVRTRHLTIPETRFD